MWTVWSVCRREDTDPDSKHLTVVCVDCVVCAEEKTQTLTANISLCVCAEEKTQTLTANISLWSVWSVCRREDTDPDSKHLTVVCVVCVQKRRHRP